MNASSQQPENYINIGKLIRLILMQSKLIFLIVFVCFLLGVTKYFISTPIYKFSSLIQVYASNQLDSGFNEFDLFSASQNTDNIDNISALYKSRTNLLEIILQNNAYLQIEDDEINKDDLFSEIFFHEDSVHKIALFILFDEVTFKIYDENENFIKENSYDKLSNVNGISFRLNKQKKDLYTKIVLINPQNLINTKKNAFEIVRISTDTRSFYAGNKSKLLRIDFNTTDLKGGKSILNSANNIFINSSIQADAAQANKAIGFIDERILQIEKELDIKKQEFQSFKEKNKTIDLNSEVENIIGFLSGIENEINRIDVELSTAESAYTESNPLFKDLKNKKNALINQKFVIEDKIKTLPLAQQKYVDLFSSVENLQSIYQQLQIKKLEFSIKEASTIGNIRIVDSAYLNKKISPRLSSVASYIAFGALLSIIFAIYRGLFILRLSNPAEIQDSDIDMQIVSVIPDVNEEIETAHNLEQSLEQLFLNIETLLKNKDINSNDGTIISITSATQSNGKTFVTSRVGTMLSRLGKKVLIIDGDWKRGRLHKVFNTGVIRKETVNEKVLEDGIRPVQKNVDFLPRVGNSAKSFEFMYSDMFTEIINSYKQKYDYIIIDTAPVLSVSDTNILLSLSNINFAVVRHGLTKINEIKQMINITSQLGIEFDGVIYNGYKKPSSYYGYYGLYGSYSYQYYANKYLSENEYKYDEE